MIEHANDSARPQARRLSPVDQAINRFDALLRGTLGVGREQRRPSPAADLPDPPLSADARRASAGMMRVNHTGEVCAQALYLGQALVARRATTAAALYEAAREEEDHLMWCEERLRDLGAGPSVLNPLWFAGSVATGVAAAAVGDRVSLGFVEETERQVVEHLEGHLARLDPEDARSRAICGAMRDDEARHGRNARLHGATSLPYPVRVLMSWQARVMTTLATHI